MSSSTSRLDTSSPRRLLTLWTCIFAGPFLYLFDLELSYSLANRACSSGSRALYALSTIVAALLVTGALVLARRQLEQLPDDADASGARAIDRNRFLAISGVVFSAGFLLLILAHLVPKLTLALCD